jgi:hypothetical protein
MRDLLMIGVFVATTLVFAAYVALCDWIIGENGRTAKGTSTDKPAGGRRTAGNTRGAK